MYNQAFKITELQLEIEGLSCDLLSVSNTALRNAHNAGEYSSANLLVQRELMKTRAELQRHKQMANAIKAFTHTELAHHSSAGHKARQLNYQSTPVFDHVMAAPKDATKAVEDPDGRLQTAECIAQIQSSIRDQLVVMPRGLSELAPLSFTKSAI